MAEQKPVAAKTEAEEPTSSLVLNPLQKKLHLIEDNLSKVLIERKEEIHGLTLAILSGLNMLLLGPPGVAKSYLVTWWAKMITGANTFEWLLTKFSTPEELFGPYSLKGLEEDRYVRNVANKLPEADIAFIDETFKGNAGILNSLLTVLNERKFYNDGKAIDLPLLTLVGASNEIPESDDGLDAMFDRMLLKYVVQPIREQRNRAKMLGDVTETVDTGIITLEEIKQIQQEVAKVKIPEESLKLYSDVIKKLGDEGLGASDRTYKLSTKLLKAEAYFYGRNEVNEADFDILQHVLWTDPANKKKLYSFILEITNPIKNKIVELFEDGQKQYTKAIEEPAFDKDQKVNQKYLTATTEALAKLKTIKEKLEKHRKALKAEGKDVVFIEQYLSQLSTYQNELFERVVGTSDII